MKRNNEWKRRKRKRRRKRGPGEGRVLIGRGRGMVGGRMEEEGEGHEEK